MGTVSAKKGKHERGYGTPEGRSKGGKTAAEERNRNKVEGNKRMRAAYRPPSYTSPTLMAYRLADYFWKQDGEWESGERKTERRPYTEAGLRRALNIASEDVYAAYRDGERDYLSDDTILSQEGSIVDEHISRYSEQSELQPYFRYLMELDFAEGRDGELPFSVILKNARLLISEQREETLAISGKVADIFTMKAREGWQDEKPQNLNQTLVLTGDSARKSLELLGIVPPSDDE